MFHRLAAILVVFGLVLSPLFPSAAAQAASIQPVLAAPQQDACASPANEIVAENCLPGNPESEWDIDLDPEADATLGAGDPSIQGFATDISVNRGSTIQFKIDNKSGNAYTIPIYRLGYYGGNGARLITTLTPTQLAPQPVCSTAEQNGFTLLDCGNWSVSASWNVPANAASGVYIARPTRTGNGGASHIVFIVRDDASDSDLIFQTSDTTWQSYNPFGGYNAYGTEGAQVAPRLSYNRPFATRAGELENWLFNAEYPMIRWLERNGYDVSYMAAVDTERNANLIANHEAFLSVGHDEYWSQGRRDAVTAARGNGVHLAFFSANEIYWKTRWENSAFGNQQYRTQVTFKEGNAAPSGMSEHRFCDGAFTCDPSGIWTGLWRQAPGSTPENSLSGQISWRYVWPGDPITVPGDYAALRFWRNTDVAGLAPNGEVTLTDGMLGYEVDPEYAEYAEWYPAGRIKLSTTDFNSFAGTDQHHLSLYRYGTGPNSALVFGAGTVQWSWGLDSNHDRGNAPADRNAQQATLNLLADMGAQPATKQTDLVAATASTDTTPPTAQITSPANGAEVQAGLVTISGTAADSGGVVAGVEVSVDGGTTWRTASGRGNWTYTWMLTTPGSSATLLARAVDDSANLGANSAAVTVNVTPRTCPCSIWENTAPGTFATELNGNAVELGVRFQSDTDGYITAVRFYKPSGGAGTYTVNLWTTSGTNLGSGVMEIGAEAGWQEIPLGDAAAIDAGVPYIASYHSPTGIYIYTAGALVDAISNPPIRTLPSESGAPNGVYAYSPTSAFPNTYWDQSPNYWVDPLFVEEVGEDTTPPVVSATTPIAGAINVLTTVAPSATFNERLLESSVSPSTVALLKNGSPVAATVAYLPAARRIAITPDAPLAYETQYTVRLTGGAAGIKNEAGLALASDYTFSFTTRSEPPPPPVEGPGGPIVVVGNVANPFTRYYAEILRAEGLNAFDVVELSALNATNLANYKVAIVGEMEISPAQATLFTNWVNAGGNLIAMRPDSDLLSLLGLSAPTEPALANGYMQVNTSVAPGAGIVSETIQYHGAANRYGLAGATSVATLYSSATVATTNPAVTLRTVSGNGGQAGAFAFDLAKSVVYTRQGNPEWAGDERDGTTPVRSNDMFYGNKASDPQTDWVDLNKVAIPQADEAQRLLANMITHMLADDLPMPRLWYFPRGEKAVVVMTHDDHGSGDIIGRLDLYNFNSPAGCSVEDWECVRSTTYLYTTSQISDGQLAAFQNQGHEFAVHVNTNCADFSLTQLENFYTSNFAAYELAYPSANTQTTQRTHCIAFSDWFSQPTVQLANGVRMDTNYYFWPGSWVQNRPGMFTGSGMPMRFADVDGTMIDVYQATTQMTDESGQSFAFTIDTLLDRALGTEGYYGAFVANQHTDGFATNALYNATVTVSSAQARGVPVISAEQLLEWTDARNASYVSGMMYDAGSRTLTFTMNADAGANGLTAMVPALFQGEELTAISKDGSPVSHTIVSVKGVQYAQFVATDGVYTASFDEDETAPTLTGATPTDNATDVPVNSAVTATFSEPMNFASLQSGFTLAGPGNASVVATLTWDSANNRATLTPDSALTPNTNYVATVAGTVTDLADNALSNPLSWQFTTAEASTGQSIWEGVVTPAIPVVDDNAAYDLGVKFRSSEAGYIAGIRFWRGSTEGAAAGPFIVTLWDPALAENVSALATATSALATEIGWQVATFSAPVAIEANKTYIASYFVPAGAKYPANNDFFTAGGVENPPLTALAAGVDGPNGVFREGGGRPNTSYRDSNYWVDVVFVPEAPVNTAPQVLSHTPGGNATSVALNSAVSVTFSEAMNTASVEAGFTLERPDTTPVAGSFAWSGGNTVVTFTPAASLDANTVYTAKVADTVTDVEGLAMGVPVQWSFTTTAGGASTAQSIWDDSATPDQAPFLEPNGQPDTAAYNLGVRFQAAVDGEIVGIRFHRGPDTNTPGSILYGQLWKAQEQEQLSLGTTPNHTMVTPGWQEVLFNTPIAIEANTTYVASYYTSNGRYSYTGDSFGAPVVNGDLTALQNGVAGPNGAFSAPGGFPNLGGGANYWVDVLFQPSTPQVIAPQVIGRVPAGNATAVALDANVVATFDIAMNPATITGGNITLQVEGNPAVLPAAVSYDPGSKSATLNPTADLAYGTTYRVTVKQAVASADNVPMAADVTWTFTTAAETTGGAVTDDDFAGGTQGSPACYVTQDGTLMLSPFFGTEFDSALDPAWVTPWQGGSSVASVSGGLLTVDGAMVGPTAASQTYGVLEFVATFGAQSNQHAGLGVNFNDGEPWVIFSTWNQTTNLYARVNPGSGSADANLGAIPVGPHRYRIEWDEAGIRFFIDGVLMYTTVATFGTAMRPIVSDLTTGTPLTVDWMRMSPFAEECTFTSRVLDGGEAVEWLELTSTDTRPTGTTVAFETRSGNSATPDGTWSGWQAVTGNTVASPDGRYIQYRVTLATSDVDVTPVIEEVNISFNSISVTPPDLVLPLALTWNLLSLPRDLGDVSIEEALAPIEDGYALVYAYQTCGVPEETWLVYNPADMEHNTLTDHDPMRGYWVFVTEEGVNNGFEVQGEPFTQLQVDLCEGWNLVGFPYEEAVAVEEAIAGCGDQVRMLYAFDLNNPGEPWLKHRPGAAGNTFDTLEPGSAYWVYSTGVCELGNPAP